MRLAILLCVARVALGLSPVILKTSNLTYTIASDGLNSAFLDPASGKNYLDASNAPHFMTIEKDGKRFGSTAVELENGSLLVKFGDSGVIAKVQVRPRPQYLTFELTSINDQSVSIVELAALPLKLAQSVSRSLASCRNDDYAVAVVPLNLETHSDSKQVGGVTFLRGEADRRVRLEGAKIAVVGCPTKDLLNRIERIEIENGLPHPTLGGVWARKSPEQKKSYLFVDVSEATADSIIDYAKSGGFSYVVVYDGVWNASHGTYPVNRANFPNGDAGLKAVSKKIHTAGLKFGMHNLDMVIAKNDALVRPVPAQGFMMYPDRRRILGNAIGPKDTFIPTTNSPAGLLTKADKSRFHGRDLRIGDEIITYDDLQTTPPYGFTGCVRGAHGTVATAHPAGSAIDNFSEFVGFYRPDVKGPLYDQVARAEAQALDRFGFDYIYPDGTGENLEYWPDEPHWYITNLLTAKLFRYTQREVMFAHEPISDYSWHVFSRGNTTDFVTSGIIEHFDRVTLAGAGGSMRDLQPFEFGWFGFFTHSTDVDATRPREMEYAWCKALAYGAAMSLETSKNSLDGNGRTREIFALIKNWEDLKLRDYFPQTIREQLKAPGREFAVQQTANRQWQVVPVIYSPTRYVVGNESWGFDNPYLEQPLRVTVEARPTLAAYGDQANRVLLKPGTLNLYTSGNGPLGSPSRQTAGLQFKIEPVSDHFDVSAVNGGPNPQGWGCAEIVLDTVMDLRQHRALGTWVEGDGSGAFLHFVIEDSGRWSVRDYYVRLSFKGWRYIQMPESAKGEVYDFAFPYSNYWSIRGLNFAAISRLYVFLTGVKSGLAVTASFRRLEALHENPLPLLNPTLRVNDQSVTFPVQLEPDWYLEYDGSAKARVFDPNGFTKAEVTISRVPSLRRGPNVIELSCDRVEGLGETAKVTLATRGEPSGPTVIRP